ncbi:hypothetical protein DOU04_11000 [Clavibacter michiganensis subsp. michiganensis]|uniref:ABC transporter substrate-binding protein n=1 Tax=Clavibacter michiganensis TaxID=28447 RepID=UPI00136616D6|nr:ABC transporter substrate-binding protein [Clavibacter michiganensis]MWJ01306.1 hypothetical protein [Clavibacter michiganensis subsp. michiganensis]
MTTLPRRHPAIVAALLALAITAGAAGCAPSSASSADAAASGGTLRAAFPGGGAAETLDYLVGPTALDYVRARLVHAPFCEIDASAADGVAYGALSSIDVSPDLSSYTLHVRPDVPFTDGSTLTAADVIYSLRAPGLLHGLPFTQIVARDLDVDAATSVDDLTVTLPTRHPVADGSSPRRAARSPRRPGSPRRTRRSRSCGRRATRSRRCSCRRSARSPTA